MKPRNAPGRSRAARKVLADYCAGRSLLDSLRAVPEPRGAILDALLALEEAINNIRPMEEVVPMAAAADGAQEDRDADLDLLFMHKWFGASLRADRYAEAEALLHRMESLASGNVLAEMRAEIIQDRGLLVAGRGDMTAHERGLTEAIAVLPRNSPLRARMVWNRALDQCLTGRGVEAEADLSRLERSGGDYAKPGVLALARFFDAVQTGRQEEVDALFSEVERNETLARRTRHHIERNRIALALMRGDAIPLPPGSAEPHWAASARCLLERRPEEALRHAREEAATDDFLGQGAFPAYTLIRAELAAGNGGAARRLMDVRRSAGNRGYLDGLFLARADWLEGRGEAAARLFAGAVESCRAYRAEGRLEFELRLACELSPEQAFRLIRTATAISADAREPIPPPRSASPEPRGADRLIGPSGAMDRVRESVRKLAALDVSVLITGETGTGKELVARALHEAGPRAAEPFLAINCGAIAESLLESELFGHEKGAFTGAVQAHRGVFEEAGRGTVFLDEIGEISARLQAALLRVLEAGEVRPVGSASSRKIACRIVAATNAALPELVERGTFRKDLLYRLRRMEVDIPPLRLRREDVVPLARHYLNLGRRPGERATMTAELESMLELYEWPGNVRELRNEIERMRLLNSDRLSYDLEHVSLALATMPPPAVSATEDVARPGAAQASPAAPAGGALAEGEDALPGNSVMRRLERLRGLFARHGKVTRAEAARLFGVTGNTATALMKRLVAERLIEKVEPTKSPRTHYFRLRSS